MTQENKRPTILIVDDTPTNLSLLSNLLKEHYRIRVANSGAKALELANASVPDLVILDIMMPEMDGYQTLKEIRNNSKLATIPVVALTAKALNADREKALATGADDFLSKPVEYEALINMAKVWCAGKHE